MQKYRFISLRDNPMLIESAALWFHHKWGVSKSAYLKCMKAYLNGETEYGWYLCLDKDKIVGGLGVVENDFHSRKDLFPNVCAIYTEKEHRCKGISGTLLSLVVKDLQLKGITPIYLLTDHIGFYERYGWKFLCMAKDDNEEKMSRIYIYE